MLQMLKIRQIHQRNSNRNIPLSRKMTASVGKKRPLEVESKTDDKIQDIDSKIRTLKQIRTALVKLKNSCQTSEKVVELSVRFMRVSGQIVMGMFADSMMLLSGNIDRIYMDCHIR